MKLIFILYLTCFTAISAIGKNTFYIDFRDAETEITITDKINIQSNQTLNQIISNGILTINNYSKKIEYTIISDNYNTEKLLFIKPKKKGDTTIIYLQPNEKFMDNRWEFEKDSLKNRTKNDTLKFKNYNDFLTYLSRNVKTCNAAWVENKTHQSTWIELVINKEGEIEFFDISHYKLKHKTLNRCISRSLWNLPSIWIEEWQEDEDVRYSIPLRIRG